MSFEKFSEKSASDLFGPFSPHFGNMGQLVYKEKEEKLYKFMNNDEFGKLSIAEMNRIMWDEIIQRAELCSYLTIERTSRLALGAIDAYEDKNLLAWAGSARGLIESVADSFYVLRSVSATFASNHETIKRCISGEATEKVVSSKKLEEELIHFTHARVLSDIEVASSGHKARSARDYISTLNESGRPDAYEAYQDLCNLTHPSAYTLIWMLDNHNQDNKSYSFTFNPQRQREYGQILAMSMKYRNLFHSLLQTSMNSSLLALIMCQSLGRQGTGTKNVDVSDLPAWDHMINDISESSSNNIVRVITGFYKKK